MSSKVRDYLTKQIFIEKNIVTFRSLSRQFNIHVNLAKRELANFYENTQSPDERSFASYLISGELFPNGSSTPDVTSSEAHMEIDDEEVEAYEEDGEEVVPELKMTLAGEQDLGIARSGYARIFSEHIYSLSPSPVLDVGLLCGPSDAVYAADAKINPQEGSVLGRITGSHVQVGKAYKSAPSVLRAREPPAKRIEPAAPHQSESEPTNLNKEDKIEEKPITLKSKPPGKLDWSKAKVKGEPSGNNVKVKAEKDEKIPEKADKKQTKVAAPSVNYFFGPKGVSKKAKEDPSTVRKDTKTEKAKTSEPPTKRGVKRKITPPKESDSEQEVPPTSCEPSSPITESQDISYKLERNAIISDDEESRPLPTRAKGKRKPQVDLDLDALPSKATASLRAMMDIDDEQVEKVVRSRRNVNESSDDEPLDEDVMMEDPTAEDSDIPVEKPKRKRKEKKVVPVGRNGLKKKRVVKTRTTMDEKGYMATEDYSEYESVDEEQVEDPPAKSQTVKTKPAEATSKTKEKAGAGAGEQATRKVIKPGPLKRSASSAAGSKVMHKGSLMTFFGKK